MSARTASHGASADSHARVGWSTWFTLRAASAVGDSSIKISGTRLREIFSGPGNPLTSQSSIKAIMQFRHDDKLMDNPPTRFF